MLPSAHYVEFLIVITLFLILKPMGSDDENEANDMGCDTRMFEEDQVSNQGVNVNKKVRTLSVIEDEDDTVI